MATGLDEEHKKPKNLADQVVRLLDEEAITFPDRLRLIIEYLLYRDGLLPSDVKNLLAHAQLPAQDGEVIHNLELLGAHVSRQLKESRPVAQSFFARKPAPPAEQEVSLSRFEPTLKSMLEEHIRGSLDQIRFPFTKPHLDSGEGTIDQENPSQASLRSAKPKWARTRSTPAGPKQRIIVFMAGGATYSESRACYELSESFSKDIFLVTSHMLTPSLFLRQVGDLSVDRRRLNLPVDQPKPKAPAHLFERDPPPAQKPAASAQQPPTAGIGSINLNSNGKSHGSSANGTNMDLATSSSSKLGRSKKEKEKEKEKDSEKKKKHHFFSSKK